MEIEKQAVKLKTKNDDIVNAHLELFEEISNEPDIVAIELIIDGQNIRAKSENFFEALVDLRKELEKRSMQILCNGTAEIVYPSPMQLSMGTGRVAYKQYLGQQARMADVVDIFECDESLCFVKINEQSEYHKKWLQSIAE